MGTIKAFEKGERVLLTCAGNAGYGSVQLVSPNQQALMIELEDGLRTPAGLHPMSVALYMKDDGEYYELISDSIVKVERPTY